MTILVVDDEHSVRTSLLRVLRARGYDAVGASDGPEALQKALEKRPDVILMDLLMPAQNGLEATRNIKTQSHLADVPVIALTASSVPGEARSLFQTVLTKPCLSADLLDAIEKVAQR